MLSIIIPTYNEEKRIERTLGLLEKWLFQNRALVPSYEIIISDDGSDGTVSKALSFAKKAKIPLKAIRVARREGKGGAIMKALANAKGDALLYDADAATHPKFIAYALEAAQNSGADLVLGSREMQGAKKTGNLPFERRLATKAFNLFVNALLGLSVTDSQCGFKFIKREAYRALLPKLKHKWYEFDVELIAKAKKAGFKIAEIPIEWRAIEGGKMKKRYTIGMVLGTLSLKWELMRQSK